MDVNIKHCFELLTSLGANSAIQLTCVQTHLRTVFWSKPNLHPSRLELYLDES